MNTDTNVPAGVTEADFSRHPTCPVCGKPILGPGAGMTFYRIRIEHCVADAGAINRRIALGTLTGSQVLASVLSPDPYLGHVFDGPTDALVHEVCAMDSAVIPLALTEARKTPR